MYKSLLTLLAIVALSAAVLGQKPQDDIDFEDFNAEFLKELIFKQLASARETASLHSLNHQEELEAAAQGHASYIKKLGRIVAEQTSKKKKTTLQRVVAAGGLNARVGEIYEAITVGAKVRIKGSSNKFVLKSYENAAAAIVQGWMVSKDMASIILDPEMYNHGIGLVPDQEKKVIYVCYTVGCEPFQTPIGAKVHPKAFKIKPYSRSECADVERNFPYLPELLSNSIYFENGKIYFYFHDLGLFKEFMKNGKDAIALDIVTKNQFSCESGNRLYPSEFHRGVLMKPVKKAKLLAKNELKQEGEVWTAIADLPSFVDTNTTEFNIQIIKNKCLCQSIYYNNVGGANISMLDIDWALDTVKVSAQADSIKRTLEFDVRFAQGKSNYKLEDIKQFLDSIELYKYNIKRIDLTAYSSIEGSESANKTLQKKRANSILRAIEEYKLQDVDTRITTEENWEEFMALIAESPYAEKFKAMTKEQIRSLVNSDTTSINLEPYLRDQRKAHIAITVESVVVDSKLVKVLMQRMKEAIAREDVVQAKAIQTILVNEARDGAVEMEEVLNFDIPQRKSLLSLYSNQLALKAIYFEGKSKDSLMQALRSRLIALLAIDPENPYLLYNKHLITLHLWSSNSNTISDPPALAKEIRQLYNSRIQNYMVNRLLLNYNIIASDFYYDNKKFDLRDKTLKEVRKFLLRANLNRDNTYEISGYFMFQMKLEWAIEIMLPFAIKDDIDEDFLYSFLRVAIYDKEQVPPATFEKLLNKASELNRARFCTLFGYPNMSFQLLENKAVKKVYCKSCND